MKSQPRPCVLRYATQPRDRSGMTAIEQHNWAVSDAHYARLNGRYVRSGPNSEPSFNLADARVFRSEQTARQSSYASFCDIIPVEVKLVEQPLRHDLHRIISLQNERLEDIMVAAPDCNAAIDALLGAQVLFAGPNNSRIDAIIPALCRSIRDLTKEAQSRLDDGSIDLAFDTTIAIQRIGDKIAELTLMGD